MTDPYRIPRRNTVDPPFGPKVTWLLDHATVLFAAAVVAVVAVVIYVIGAR